MGRKMTLVANPWDVICGKSKAVTNHRGAVGEIGVKLSNHTVYQKGTIGKTLCNHKLDDGAPTPESVIQFKCDETALAKQLGLYSYPIRALVTTNQGDVFQIGEELKPGLAWLCEHYKRIGIDCASEFIYTYDFSVAHAYKDLGLSVFFFGLDAHDVRPDMDRLLATEKFNNKNYVIELAKYLSVRAPGTKLYLSVNEVSGNENFRFPVAVKIGTSVSGLGFKKCYNPGELADALNMVPDGVDFQIQDFLEGADFLSMQWWINDDRSVIPITGTMNFIEGDANHLGNWGGIDIPHEALVEFTYPIVMSGAKAGLRDWISVDVGCHNEQFYVVECNPRYTGAAYPYIAVMKLLENKARESFWAHKSYKTSLRSIGNFDLGALEYDPTRKSGWVAINPGPLTVGDGGISMLYIGLKENYKKSEEELQALLA